MLKNYQLEFNFKEEKEASGDQEEQSITDMQNTCKGSKSFIEQMMKDEEEDS